MDTALYLLFMMATEYGKMIAQLPDGGSLAAREAAITLIITLGQCLLQVLRERKP